MLSLPSDMILEICEHLDEKSLGNLQRVDKKTKDQFPSPKLLRPIAYLQFVWYSVPTQNRANVEWEINFTDHST